MIASYMIALSLLKNNNIFHENVDIRILNLTTVAKKQIENLDLEIKALQQALAKADLQALKLKSIIAIAEEQLKLSKLKRNRAASQQSVN